MIGSTSLRDAGFTAVGQGSLYALAAVSDGSGRESSSDPLVRNVHGTGAIHRNLTDSRSPAPPTKCVLHQVPCGG